MNIQEIGSWKWIFHIIYRKNIFKKELYYEKMYSTKINNNITTNILQSYVITIITKYTSPAATNNFIKFTLQTPQQKQERDH